jgi:demethylmenaquinone methyltransferase/2-methoxy-6-polyprenyl-1,4-benzoquinol methylase
MKAFEVAPGRYDLGMRLVTFGAIGRVHEGIAGSIEPGASVLDVGCGTGGLLPLVAGKHATVRAIDRSAEMVQRARARAVREGIQGGVTVHQNTAMEIDRLFRDAEFDAVVLSLVLSELTEDEQVWVLRQCARVLKPGGTLLVADEFRPRSLLKRLAFSGLRLPLHLTAYLYTQVKSLEATGFGWKLYYTVVELPLMLISFAVGEPLTRPLGDVGEMLPGGLRVAETRGYAYCPIRLLKIRREDGSG